MIWPMSDLRLKKLREEQGLTQSALAERLRIETGHQVWPETISRIERGVNSPAAWMAGGLARILGTTVDYILGLTDDPEPPPAPARSSTQLVVNEAQPAYTPLTREVAQLAVRLNRLPAAPRAKITAAFTAVVELTENQPLTEDPPLSADEALSAPAGAAQAVDARLADQRRRLFRLLDQLTDEEVEEWARRIQAAAAAEQRAADQTG